jgi:dipeptidyl aminopeptidase/acylaminoacyl peptidase
LIAYESEQNGRYNIYQISPAGGAPQLLIRLGSSSSTPAWSPDGDHIAFEVKVGDVRHIWMAERDGRNPAQVTFLGPDDRRPAWSPDGEKIAFHSNYQNGDEAAYDIWIIDIASQSRKRITDSGACYNPAWSAASRPQTTTAVACDLAIGDLVTTGPAARFWSYPDVNVGSVATSIRQGAPLTVIDGPVLGRIQYDSTEAGWWWQLETQFEDRGWLWQERLVECATGDG